MADSTMETVRKTTVRFCYTSRIGMFFSSGLSGLKPRPARLAEGLPQRACRPCVIKSKAASTTFSIEAGRFHSA